jgi:hypothetical protein
MKEETNPTWMEVHGGFAKDMTLRDHYAGLAMQKMLGAGDYQPIAANAYAMADEMLKAREK